jgi:hypothetical protein
VIYFKKAILKSEFNGVFQYINQSFASILPDEYETVNHEQDLGKKGLRQAKGSYNPVDFVEKNKVRSQ